MADWSGTTRNPLLKQHYRSVKKDGELKADIRQELKHVQDYGNSTDENEPISTVTHLINESEEDALTPDAVTKHYGRFSRFRRFDLSDSAHSGLDEEEEEKMEQDITSRLSHLQINRSNEYALPWTTKSSWNGNHHIGSDRIQNDHNSEDIYDDTEYDLTLCADADSVITEMYHLDVEDDEIRVDVAHPVDDDEQMENYHQSLYNKHCGVSDKEYRFNFREEFLSNEVNFVDIQKAFHLVMLLLGGGSGKVNGQRLTKSVQRVYNLICMGCLVLLKKYKKLGALYIYTTFWMQLSALFMHSGQLLSKMGSVRRMDSILMRKGGALSRVVHCLLTIYSRIYLFTKVLTPMIQKYWRNGKHVGSLGSVLFLISGYAKAGDGLIKTFVKRQ